MRKQFFLLLFLGNGFELYSQEKINSNKIGLSIPIVWNNSNGVYYSLGSRKEPSGNALSYGINVNYSLFVYQDWFLIGGGGYFKQRFDIQRPFQYRAPNGSEPLVSTTKYSYQTFQFLLGVGYQHYFRGKWGVTGQLSYNHYNSYKQKYKQDYAPGKNEDFKKSFVLGNMVNLELRCERYVNQRVSVGSSILVPLHTNWKDDNIFNKYDYANDTQITAKNKLSIGANFSFYYHLKNKRL
jgi:hypothetical protein